MEKLRVRYRNWRVSPRRWQVGYIVEGLKSVWRAHPRDEKTDGDEMLSPPIETEYVDLLFDEEFRRSVAEVKDYTCLDFARLANLWNLARMAEPGIFVEVGSYRGGTAWHICNAIESTSAEFFCFDPFEAGGFEKLEECDRAFACNDFTDTHYAKVVNLLASKPRAYVVQGFFPGAAEELNLRGISFCHLDVDIYRATIDSLRYLAPRLTSRGMIVLDDLDHRETPGVRKAAMEFVAENPEFLFLPLFPCQGVLCRTASGEAQVLATASGGR